MELRKMQRDTLVRAYGVDAELLLPWPALNVPFDGAWCVLRPGDESTPHSHHEYEIFIAMTGRAVIVSDGTAAPFAAGDIVHHLPGTTHHVVNDTDADFEYYAIWWDAATAARFTTRAAGVS